MFDLRSFMVKWKKYRREFMKLKKGNAYPWLLMFTATNYDTKEVNDEIISDLEEWAMNIEQVREALIEWETLSANKENRVIFKARAKELRDLLSNLEGERRLGREEGLEKGREEEKKEIAIEMLKEGIPVETIEKVTKLGLSEIEKLEKRL